jgi:hypothetical protein
MIAAGTVINSLSSPAVISGGNSFGRMDGGGGPPGSNRAAEQMIMVATVPIAKPVPITAPRRRQQQYRRSHRAARYSRLAHPKARNPAPEVVLVAAASGELGCLLASSFPPIIDA